MCAFLGVEHLTVAVYHLQTYVQTESLNETNLVRLQGYVAGHQKDWDKIAQLRVYRYNTQVHQTKKQTLFSLALSQHPLRTIFMQSNNAISSDAYGKTTLRVLRARSEAHTCALGNKVDANGRQSQQQHKKNYNCRKRENPIYKPDGYIFLARPHLAAAKDQNAHQRATGADKKLLPCSTGPLRIINVQPQTVITDEHSIENTATNDQVVQAPATPRYSPTDRTQPSCIFNEKSLRVQIQWKPSNGNDPNH